MKLYRPSTPVEVKLRVALRQLGEMSPDAVILENRYVPRRDGGRSLGKVLRTKLAELAQLLACDVKDLRLDHNPALGLRKNRRTGKTIVVGGEPVDVLLYTPPANDPEYLIYRSHHAHHIKTNVAGDRGQYSDTTLMKRERRRKRKAAAKAKGVRPLKRGVGFRPKSKASIPARSNPWPPKGSRPFRRRDDAKPI